jgi:hypothetical protein
MYRLTRENSWPKDTWDRLQQAVANAKPLALLTVGLVLLGLVLLQWQYALAIAAAGLLTLAPSVWPSWRRLKRYVLPSRFVLFILVVACALFSTEQGQDLGAGLLDATHWQLLFFGAALLYWATANWHTAQVAFNRDKTEHPWAWPSPELGPDGVNREWERDWWVRWWPRLLGVAVYLLATLIVALAGRRAHQSLYVYLPTILLSLALLVLMVLDRLWARAGQEVQSLRTKNAALIAALGGAAVLALYFFLQSDDTIWPYIVAPLSAAIFLSLALSGVLQGLYELPRDRPIEQPQTSVGPAVAPQEPAVEDRAVRSKIVVALLLAVATIREIPRNRPRSIFAFCLLSVVVPVAAVAWLNPVWLGQSAGSVTIAFFAFGAYMTALETVWLLGGERTKATLAFLLLLALATGLARDYHTVRTCRDPLEHCYRAQSVREQSLKGESAGDLTQPLDPRPTLESAARFWRRQAGASRPVPMIVVATAGGGLRAAYWTALMLEQLEEKLGAETFRRHLFAISGVSGGSLGAAFYADTVKRNNGSGKGALRLLDHDFLGPAVAAMAFVDGPASILPNFGRVGRGYALERSWEAASSVDGDPGLAAGFLELFPTASELEAGELKARPWQPSLLLNATHQQTGRRVIASHLRSEPHVFLDSWDLWELLRTDVPASTAAHNSARFTYVSPAGRLAKPKGQGNDAIERLGFVLDGGYFENYGAITALQLIRHALSVLYSEPVHPIIILISSDPALREQDHARIGDQDTFCRGGGGHFHPEEAGRGNAFLNELAAPAAGILASREAHGTLAAKELGRFVCVNRQRPAGSDNSLGAAPLATPSGARPAAGGGARATFVHFVMCEDKGTAPPLGWVLSSSARKMIHRMIDDPEQDRCGNRAELEKLTGIFAVPPKKG